MEENTRLQELVDKFPEVPRSIILKTDILREGCKFTSAVHEAGEWALPHFLIWNPDHVWNPTVRDLEAGQVTTTPWKFDLPDETPVLLRFDSESPYEIRKDNGKYGVYRDGVRIEDITFERRPEWPYKLTRDGDLMVSVFIPWSRRALLGCALRYCEYTKTGDQCVYCCLDANLKEFKKTGFKYRLSMTPEEAAEVYRAAEEENDLRYAGMTGGSLLDTKKESERYVKIFAAMNAVRKEIGKRDTTRFDLCVTAPPDRKLIEALKEAGVDSIGPNMDCWDERLWPVIVPGKHKFVGRDVWLKSIELSTEVFGAGQVFTVFVVGPEMNPPHGFQSVEDGIASWRRAFEWLAERGVFAQTAVWQTEVGSPWGNATPPPTEYFLTVDLERHRVMQEAGLYDKTYHRYYRVNCWTCSQDYCRLVCGCKCPDCQD
jgi:hypothetical protein